MFTVLFYFLFDCLFVNNIWYLWHFSFSISAVYAYIFKNLPMCLVLYVSKSVICMSVRTAFLISYNVLLYSISSTIMHYSTALPLAIMYCSTASFLAVMHYFIALPLAVIVPTNGVYGSDTTMTALMLLYTYVFSISINIIL